MKKILFATDFSESSRNVFPFVVKTAQLTKAELVLVHVYQIPSIYKFPYLGSTFAVESGDMASAKSKLQEIFSSYFDVDDLPQGIEYKVVRDRSAVRGILTAIDEEEPDLLMLSSEGDNVSKESIFGGMVKTLIKQTNVPVMTLPADVKAPRFNKILFTTNLYSAELLAVQKLVDLVKPFNSEIIVAHVHVSKENIEQYRIGVFKGKLMSRVPYDNLKFVEIPHGNVFQQINEYIKDNDIDILTMTEKQHGGLFYRLLNVDLIKKFEFNSLIPVMSFNEATLLELKEEELETVEEQSA